MQIILRRSPGFGRRLWMNIGLPWLIFWVIFQGSALFPGCSKTPPQAKEKALLRIGNQVVTILDFNKALEFAKSAYPHNAMQNPDVARTIKTRLLNQLTEELVLLTKAAESGIRITDAELDKAIAEIKKDYPDNTFEETFLENAISFASWRDQLKKRMVMEKLVAVEFEGKIRITPEEIAAYYKANFQGEAAEFISEQDVDESIVKEIRRQKTDAAYKEWVEAIQKRYPVELNKKLWKTIIEE